MRKAKEEEGEYERKEDRRKEKKSEEEDGKLHMYMYTSRVAIHILISHMQANFG